MKITLALSLVAILFLTAIFASCTETRDCSNTVNAVIGNAGYVALYGTEPNEETDEITLIRAHFGFVLNKLRKADVSHLSTSQLQKREQMIAWLAEYAERGIFPTNKSNTGERRPCFIDDEGRICAVGYLVEKSAGRASAELINSKHKYQYITEMHDPLLDDWIAQSGLSKEECAMIQPTYDNWYKPKYKIGAQPTFAIASRLENIPTAMIGLTLSRGYGKKFKSRAICLRNFLEIAGNKQYRIQTSLEQFFSFQKNLFNPSLGVAVEYFPKATTVWRLNANLFRLWAFKNRVLFQLKYAYAFQNKALLAPFSSPHLLTLNISLITKR